MPPSIYQHDLFPTSDPHTLLFLGPLSEEHKRLKETNTGSGDDGILKKYCNRAVFRLFFMSAAYLLRPDGRFTRASAQCFYLEVLMIFLLLLFVCARLCASGMRWIQD